MISLWVIVISEEGVSALELCQTGLPHPVGIARLFCLGGCGIFILSYISLHCMSMSSDSGRKAVYGDPNRVLFVIASLRRGKKKNLYRKSTRSLTSSSYFVVVHQVSSHTPNSGQVYIPELVNRSRHGRHSSRNYRQNYGVDLWTLSMGRGPRGRYTMVFKQASLVHKIQPVILNHSSHRF